VSLASLCSDSHRVTFVFTNDALGDTVVYDHDFSSKLVWQTRPHTYIHRSSGFVKLKFLSDSDMEDVTYSVYAAVSGMCSPIDRRTPRYRSCTEKWVFDDFIAIDSYQ